MNKYFSNTIITFLFTVFCIMTLDLKAQEGDDTKIAPSEAEETEGISTTDGITLDYAYPREYEIGEITISGTKYLNKDVLITYSGLSVGQKIIVPGEDISKAIKNLWRQGLFGDVQIKASKIVGDMIFLDIYLEERVRMSKYTFKGVKKSEEEELRNRIDLIRGRIVTDNLLNMTQNAVYNYYADKGFLNADVQIGQEIDKQFTNRVILVVDVNRGNKIKINEIIFKGRESVMAGKLKRKMSGTKERTRLNPKALKNIWKGLKKTNIPELMGNLNYAEASEFISNNIFRFKPFSQSKFLEDDYEMDKNSLIDTYNEYGFRDARVESDSIYFVDDKSINIVLNIEEGDRYYIRNIDWKGNSKYTDEQLDRILDIDKGAVYNKTLLDARLRMDPAGNDVTSLYMDDGYLFFQINPVEKAVVGDSIDLQIQIYEGTQATVDEIIITGNTKTNEHVIRREIRSLPGSKFSRSDIIRSQRELANLGFFDPEQTQINPIPNPQDGTVDIEYKVAEKPSDQLELSAGWGGRTIVGSVGVAFNNFSLQNIFKKDAWRPLPSGDGQRLSLRFQSTGRPFQSLNASFTEPWLGGKRPNAFSVSVFTSRIFSNALVEDLEKEDRILQYITGVSVGLARRLRWPDDNFALQNSINYQNYLLQNSASDFIVSDGTFNNLSFTTTLSRYSIDQPIYPRSGSNFSLTVETTLPYSQWFGKIDDYRDVPNSKKYRWAEYHKWKFKAEWYQAIVGNLVLKSSIKMGAMGWFNPQIGHGPFERFEMGGDGISNFNLYGKDILALRGYEAAQVTRGRTNTGEPFMAKYTLELRYPMSLNPSSTIYVLGFVEGGNTWGTFREFDPFKVKRSAGLGLRFFLPMFGTLGFDYGVGFDKGFSSNTKFFDYISTGGRFSVILGQEPE